MLSEWEYRLFHSNWEVRSEANIELASICKSITDPKDPRILEFGHFFKKTVAEGNVHVQLKAFDALIAYLRVADADAGRLFGKEVCDAIMAAKCLVRTRKTVDKAKEVLFLWVELGAVDAFLDAMEKAIKNKKYKAVEPALDVMIEALRKFGAEIVSPLKILKMLPELYNHQDRDVRHSSEWLVRELRRWIGKHTTKSILSAISRNANVNELEAEIAYVTRTEKPSPKIRSWQDKEPEQETISVVMGRGLAKVSVPDVALNRNVMERSEQLNLTKTEKELQKKVDELGDAAQTIRNLKSEIEKLKNEQSSTDKTNENLRKLLEVERESCKDAEEIVIDARTQVEGLKSQVKGLEYEVAQLKSEKVSLQGEIDNLKNNVIEASVGFAVDFVTCFVESISETKVKAP